MNGVGESNCAPASTPASTSASPSGSPSVAAAVCSDPSASEPADKVKDAIGGETQGMAVIGYRNEEDEGVHLIDANGQEEEDGAQAEKGEGRASARPGARGEKDREREREPLPLSGGSSSGPLSDSNGYDHLILANGDIGESHGGLRPASHHQSPHRPNGVFFTLPRLLSGRKRYKRNSKPLDGNIQEHPEEANGGSNGDGVLALVNGQMNGSSINGSLGNCSNASSTVPRSYHNHRHHKGENFLIRLMRHFSSHSIATSSPTHTLAPGAGDGYATVGRTRNGSIGKQSHHPLPSSVSNGDIRHQSQVMTVPAIVGIKNHGNTCFMNAVLQCLSNTDLLAEYFVMSHYRIDMLRHNKLHARKYGTRGEVTEQLACLLKSLWSNQYSPEISNKFKILVSKYGTQYEGSDQHDAQEFLLWLLDKAHEDLNIATKKKYKKFKNMHNQNRPDEAVAAETLENHMRCNSSFVHDLFQAQLRSSLVCRSCGKHSNTFDPYLCLSLPVPTRQTHTIIVNVTYLRKSPREVKIGVSIESQATLRELRDKVSRLIKVPEKQLVLLVLDQENGVKELAKDTEIIQELLDDMQEIQGIETPQMQTPLNSAHLLTTSSSSGASANGTGQLLILAWTNRIGIGCQGRLFGPLFSSQVLREASYKQIQSEILKTMKIIVKKGVDFNIVNDSVIFRLRVVGGLPGKCYLPDDVDHPLYMPTVDRALQCCEDKEYRGPVHLKLVVEWDLDLRQSLLIDVADMPVPVVDSNIEYVKARTQKANRASLQDCFELYFREEKLAADNAWMCPACRRRQQCIKKLSLWSVPDVFIVHLKRFRQASNAQRSKLSTLVLFPLTGLDMNSYLAPRNHSRHNNRHHTSINQSSGAVAVNGSAVGPLNESSPPSATLPAIWSPWQRPRTLGRLGSRSDDNVYDLYAVCNHHGNMQGGHYTAYCRNPIDGRWYSFDDTKVITISESSVVTSDAYILFYQRSSLSSAMSSCASSSTSGYSSFSTEHWAFRMPPFHYWSPKSSRSQDNLCETFDGNEENMTITTSSVTTSATTACSTTTTITTAPAAGAKSESTSTGTGASCPPFSSSAASIPRGHRAYATCLPSSSNTAGSSSGTKGAQHKQLNLKETAPANVTTSGAANKPGLTSASSLSSSSSSSTPAKSTSPSTFVLKPSDSDAPLGSTSAPNRSAVGSSVLTNGGDPVNPVLPKAPAASSSLSSNSSISSQQESKVNWVQEPLGKKYWTVTSV